MLSPKPLFHLPGALAIFYDVKLAKLELDRRQTQLRLALHTVSLSCKIASLVLLRTVHVAVQFTHTKCIVILTEISNFHSCYVSHHDFDLSTGTSSLEVKENQDDKSQVDCDLLRKFHPSTFCTTFPKHRPRALKRNQPLVDGKERLLYQSHLPCKRAAWAVTQKNALVQLNELRPGLRYEIVSKTGPLHAPVFSVGVEVNGFHFEGRGPTKKQAKMRAAELALRSFIQFPNASQAHTTMGNFTRTPMDFTADKLDIPDAFLKECEPSLRENCDI